MSTPRLVCYDGYVGGGPIECKSEGVWQALPKCEMGEAFCGQLQLSNSESITPTQTGLGRPGARLYVQCEVCRSPPFSLYFLPVPF